MIYSLSRPFVYILFLHFTICVYSIVSLHLKSILKKDEEKGASKIWLIWR